MDSCYPTIEPYHSTWIQADTNHSLYVEQSGNANGKPVLFIHGGPGGGTDPDCRRFFNPKYYRIILVDQRGCGKSKPFAYLEENTTRHLIEDFELIRQHLEIDCWMLFGGSWGSTLALAYAEAIPEVVTEIILRGVFLARQQDFDWLYRYGASEVFPDAWAEFLAPVPENNRHDLMAAYGELLHHDDPKVVMQAAKSWSLWEAKVSKLRPDSDLLEKFSGDDFSHALALIEHHYFANRCFLSDNQLLAQVHAIKSIPTSIVHGRYDMCCAIRGAWDLHQSLPDSALHVITEAGHSASEQGIAAQLRKCTDQFMHQ